jgi:hypothetical protein
MRTKILLGLAVLWPLASWAADSFDVNPGLWETTTSMSGMVGGSAMPAMPQIPQSALDRMPPQQRAQMEAMMKGRGAGGPQTTVRSCLTKESLDQGALGQADKSCTVKLVSSSSTKQVMHADCTHGNAKTSGDTTIERTDSEHVKGTMAIKSTEGGPQGMDVTITFSMKWLGEDCGDIKPVVAK